MNGTCEICDLDSDALVGGVCPACLWTVDAAVVLVVECGISSDPPDPNRSRARVVKIARYLKKECPR